MNIKYGDTHCSRIFLLASSRFLTIKTRGVLFDTLEVKQWKLKNGLENAMMSETHDAQKDSKMTTHQSAHFSSDNFSFNLAKIHKRGEGETVYSIVQPTVPLQKVEVPPWKNTFFWNEKSQRKVNLISAWIAWIKMIGENIGGKWPTITPEQLLHPLRIFALQMERRKIAQYLFLVGRDDKWHIRSSVWAKNLVGDFLTCATHELKKL